MGPCMLAELELTGAAVGLVFAPGDYRGAQTGAGTRVVDGVDRRP